MALRMAFKFLMVSLNGYISTFIISLIVTLGQKNLKYLRLGSLQGKLASS
jgi:hypothetical protein